MGIEDARKKFVVDKTPEFTKKVEEQKVENTNNIINIELSRLVAFRKRQPFSMYDEIKKQEVLESIRENGVLVPIIIRKIENGKYEIISGHNRVECSKELNLSTIPAQIVDCDDDKATLIMIDTNLCNRDKINPIEKGYAYKMKMKILKNNPNISNINDFEDNSPMGTEDSKTQIYRYIRLTELIKSLQEKIINEDLSMRAGVELSYLSKEEQEIFTDFLIKQDIKNTPYKNVFLIQMFTGMRIGEVLALKVTDIDLAHNIINVEHTISVDAEEKTIMKDTPKSFNGMEKYL